MQSMANTLLCLGSGLKAVIAALGVVWWVIYNYEIMQSGLPPEIAVSPMPEPYWQPSCSLSHIERM